MKKKFLSSLLFAALVGGAVSTFTACKDYDDDINSLRSKIDNLETVKAVKADVDAALASLKSQLEAAKGELEAADAKLQAAIDTKADKTALASLEARVATLESKVAVLEGLEAKLTALIDKKADLVYVNEELDKKADKVTVEAALVTINEVLDKKADKVYVDALYATLITVDGKLGAKLLPLVQDEVNALRNGAVKNLEMQLEAISKMTTQEGTSPLVDAIKKLQSQVGDYDIKTLSDKMQELSDKIDSMNAELNLLSVLVKQGLRSLVFQPQAYYWGVEATRLFTLDNVQYGLQATAWDKFETATQAYNGAPDYGYKTYNRYPSEDFFKILDFVAEYHMNPSTAVLDPAKHSVSVLSGDKEFVTRAAEAEAGLSVGSWETKNGNLLVNLKVANKAKIKTVADDQAITVFAAQAHIGDTTITSDYATIIKKNISDVKIYHKIADVAKADGQYGTYTKAVTLHPITGQVVPASAGQVLHSSANNAIACPEANDNTGIPEWNEEITEGVTRIAALTPSRTLGPVLGTVKQSVDYFTQDWVLYNCAGIDLKELVCVRVWDGTAPIEVDPAELGLKYKFELTALHLLGGAMVGNDGAAKTSESAHAALDGDMFRPQMVTTDGKQAAYGSDQGKQTVGRTPVVRVSLVDDEGNVYDYGYIRLLILDEAEVPAKPTTVEYEGDSWSYGYECNPKAWKWENTWAQVEYDLYKLVGMTRDQFVENYYNSTLGTDGPELKSGSSTEFQQYKWDGEKFVVNKTPVGTVYQVSGIAADGTETSTLAWTVSGADALKNFKSNDNKPEIAVKYVSLNAKYPDIYVVMKPGTITIYDAPVAQISWDNLKNPSYWYANNKNESATTGGTPIAEAIEMHNNVLTPEDNPVTSDNQSRGRNFRQTISATMLNNTISGAKLFKEWTTAPAEQAANDYKAADFVCDLVFSAQNEGKEYLGESGTKYKMTVKNDGKTLAAYKSADNINTAQPVAQIVGTGVNNQQIIYGGNTVVEIPKLANFDNKDYGQWKYAKDLLNYVAHNKLDDNTIRAIVGVNLKNKCNMEVKHNDATIDVRFLRPINVTNNGMTIEDANTTKVQVIKIAELVNFTDWRDAWTKKDGPDYTKHYGIRRVTIDGLTNKGDMLSVNNNVKTNQSGEEKLLKDVNAAIDFEYTPPTGVAIAGELTYKNFSSTVDEFYVKIPLTVEYFWGEIHTWATITVKRTANNAPGK